MAHSPGWGGCSGVDYGEEYHGRVKKFSIEKTNTRIQMENVLKFCASGEKNPAENAPVTEKK